ncbi:MAG: hypothetical protein H0V24_03025 [Chloroflexia bacterium]|nr:hypothetical protein [Chloroflexia bacterium]
MVEATIADGATVDYATFIEGIELQHFWLAGAEMKNLAGPHQPEHLRIKVADAGSEWKIVKDGFVIFQTYLIRFVESDDEQRVGEITATFGLEYTSLVQPTESMSNSFTRHNVPLNVWPYFRELVASMTGRMGWEILTIPTYKIAADRPRS